MSLGGYQGIHNIAKAQQCFTTEFVLIVRSLAQHKVHNLASNFHMFDGVGRSCLGKL